MEFIFLSDGELDHKTAYKIKMQALLYGRKEMWKLKSPLEF